jgi:prepilin signal peptidase PulO-like enzyme (type II secretory pathway)
LSLLSEATLVPLLNEAMQESGFISFLVYSVVFILGSCLGSFASAVSYRTQKNLSWFSLTGQGARSFCPKCQHALSVMDLIPVLSWTWNKGRCRYCSSKIGLIYLALEIFSGLFLVLAFYKLSLSLSFFYFFLTYPILISLFLCAVSSIQFYNLLWRLFLIFTLIFYGLSLWIPDGSFGHQMLNVASALCFSILFFLILFALQRYKNPFHMFFKNISSSDVFVLSSFVLAFQLMNFMLAFGCFMVLFAVSTLWLVKFHAHFTGSLFYMSLITSFWLTFFLP